MGASPETGSASSSTTYEYWRLLEGNDRSVLQNAPSDAFSQIVRQPPLKPAWPVRKTRRPNQQSASIEVDGRTNNSSKGLQHVGRKIFEGCPSPQSANEIGISEQESAPSDHV